MKTQVLVMATAMALTVIACKKDNNLPVGDVPGDLLGSWVAVSYFESDGGPGGWSPATDNNQLSFSGNGTLSSSKFQFNAYRVDAVPSGGINPDTSVVVKLYKKGSGEQDTARYAIKTLTRDSLEMWYIQCIEGCATRFVRKR